MKSKLLIALVLGFVLHLNAADDDASNPCGALLCILGGQTSGECSKYYKYYVYELPKSCKTDPTCIAYKQLKHLKACNTNSSSTAMDESDKADINRFIETTASTNGEQCTAEALNSRVQGRLNGRVVDSWKTTGWNRQYPSHYRISTKLTTACQAHLNSKFSNLSVTNTCSDKFYTAEDWNNGYEKQLISKATYDTLDNNNRGYYYTYNPAPANLNKTTYDKLSASEKAKYKEEKNTQCDIDSLCYDNYTYKIIITNYYKKLFIKKDCWIVQTKG